MRTLGAGRERCQPGRDRLGPSADAAETAAHPVDFSESHVYERAASHARRTPQQAQRIIVTLPEIAD